MQIYFAIPPNSAFRGLLEEFFFSISEMQKYSTHYQSICYEHFNISRQSIAYYQDSLTCCLFDSHFNKLSYSSIYSSKHLSLSKCTSVRLRHSAGDKEFDFNLQTVLETAFILPSSAILYASHFKIYFGSFGTCLNKYLTYTRSRM